MKSNLRKLGVVSIAFSAVLTLAGCPSINLLDSDYESYTVVLEPNEATPGAWTLNVLSEPQGWEAGSADPVKKQGYVGFAPEKFGSVTLSLNQAPFRSTCTNDPSTSAEWVITKIALSKNGNPTSQKGMNFGSNQKGWLTSAFPQANDDGIVLDVSKSEGVVSYSIGNRNNHKGRQWVYYEVTATRCSDGTRAVTDPGWQNGGND